MTSVEFAGIVEQICKYLTCLSVKNPDFIAACKTGEDFEKCVLTATRETLNSLQIPHSISYTSGSHVFPDIVVKFDSGEEYGIEVKSSSSSTSKNWRINGNSVLGSTREKVDDTYIIFGKTALGNQDFRYKRYEDAIANVAVTHSPRYTIDMEIPQNETFFAKSGLSYQQISSSDNPIGMITTYFKSKGLKAWWLAEDAPAAIRMFSDLPIEEQSELIGHCFTHFPEIFSDSPKKFYRCAVWLMTEQSVISPCLRDTFTAGGRADISLPLTIYRNIPRIFTNLYLAKKYVILALENATIDDLRADWTYDGPLDDDLYSRLKAWISVVAGKFANRSVENYDCEKMLLDIMMS